SDRFGRIGTRMRATAGRGHYRQCDEYADRGEPPQHVGYLALKASSIERRLAKEPMRRRIEEGIPAARSRPQAATAASRLAANLVVRARLALVSQEPVPWKQAAS